MAPLELAALHAALGLALQPHLVDQARKTAFPAGVMLLLEIAAGDKDTIEKCAVIINTTEDKIRTASEFYIEQVLLHQASDSYRTLGADRSASSSSLRRNMALLMRWLHPDAMAHNSEEVRIDRSVFAERVASAWENLKTDDRRAAYDAQATTISKRVPEEIGPRARTSSSERALAVKRKTPKKSRKRTPLRSSQKNHKAPRRLKIVPKIKDNWISRILNLFRRKR
jgi:hypothetical protein